MYSPSHAPPRHSRTHAHTDPKKARGTGPLWGHAHRQLPPPPPPGPRQRGERNEVPQGGPPAGRTRQATAPGAPGGATWPSGYGSFMNPPPKRGSGLGEGSVRGRGAFFPPIVASGGPYAGPPLFHGRQPEDPCRPSSLIWRPPPPTHTLQLLTCPDLQGYWPLLRLSPIPKAMKPATYLRI